MKLAGLFFSGVISLMCALEGMYRSVFFMVLYCGEFNHIVCASFFNILWGACFAADLLCGRGLVSILGRQERWEL